MLLWLVWLVRLDGVSLSLVVWSGEERIHGLPSSFMLVGRCSEWMIAVYSVPVKIASRHAGHVLTVRDIVAR